MFGNVACIEREFDEIPMKESLHRVRLCLERECAALKRTKFDLAARRLRSLTEATGLSPIDIEILELLLRYDTSAGN